jgi:hypothetical protein
MKTPQIKAMPGMAPLGFMSSVARDQAALAQRKANAPLRPTVAQASMDVGLFHAYPLYTHKHNPYIQGVAGNQAR